MKQVIAMRKHGGEIKVNAFAAYLSLPEGCTGMLFAFESKKSARAYWGNNVDLLEYKEARDER